MTHASSCQSVSGWGRSTNEVIAAPFPPQRLLSPAGTFPPCTFLEVRAAKSRFASSELDCSERTNQCTSHPVTMLCVIVGLLSGSLFGFQSVLYWSIRGDDVTPSHLCYQTKIWIPEELQPTPPPESWLSPCLHFLILLYSFNRTTSVWALRNRRTHSFISPIDRGRYSGSLIFPSADGDQDPRRT